MAVLAIEWRISQRLKESITITWDQVTDHFLKVMYVNSLRDFCANFREVYIYGVFWPDTFVVG